MGDREHCCASLSRTIVLTLVVCLGVGLESCPAAAQTQSRDIFVSPTTGVGIGSVWGVFIGVSDYQQKELSLKYADRDARALQEFFAAQFKGRVPADQFRLVVNSQATRSRVLKELREVLRLAQAEDLVILSLALHGLPDASGHDLYFLTYNSDANLPEDQGISRDDLLKQMQRSKARKIVLLIDACHAGAFGSSPSLLALRSANAADINRMLVAMGQAQDGIAVLSASSAAERSQEGPGFCGGHGAFTCAILTGLKGAADTDGNGLVQMRELYDYAYREVQRLTTGYQNPEIQGRYDNGLPLAATGGKAKSGVPTLGPSTGGSADDLARLRQEFEALKNQMSTPKAEPSKPIEEARARPYEAPQQMGRELIGKDGAPMLLVPEGEFLYGDKKQRISLPAFYMDKYEVSTGQYATFMAATGTKNPEYWSTSVPVSNGQKPVVGVSWHEADAYCRQYGKRLPTEQEWEKAARGTDGRTYPWGNEEPTSRHAKYDQDGKASWNGYATLASVESYEAGKSPYGLYHMAGNVWEWTSSDYDNSGKAKVYRGGSWGTFATNLESTDRDRGSPDYGYANQGFRCAQDAR